MSWFQATGARLRLLFARRAAESRMDEEIRFHVEMETDRLVREEGLESREARRRALVAFGGGKSIGRSSGTAGGWAGSADCRST